MKHIIILVLGLISSFGLSAQNHYNYYVVPVEDSLFKKQDEYLAKDGSIKIEFSDAAVSNFFSDKHIYAFHKAFPTAKTEYLKRVFYISLDNDYMDEFEQLRTINILDHVSLLGEPELTFTPNDYNYNGNPNSALELINARQAWDITKGNPNVLVGITDSYFELTHEDLQNQIIQNFIYNSAIPDWHGVAVAGCVAAETNNGKGIAGIGYNCKLITSNKWGNDDEMLRLSQIPGVKVLNGSWYYLDCSYNYISELVYKEIWESGVVPVFGAGNGIKHCGGGYCYPASYDYTIAVTSIGHINDIGYVSPIYGPNNWKDVHQEVIGDINSTHQHHDKVDICAPGYNVLTTDLNNGYDGAWGTSFASPIVAGTIALMFSVNPCLSPDDVRDIIKSTAANIYSIPENQPYIGLLGAGRIDAYQAVLMAQSYLIDIQVNNNQTWTQPKNIYSDIIVGNGATLTISSTIKMADNRKITIHPGGTLILDGGTLTNACPRKLWQGITVLGIGQNQGIVQIINGGKIENAHCAITANASSAVYADDAFFVNNTIGVFFKQNADGGTFKRTKFDLNNSYLGAKRDFDAHLKIYSSGEVSVEGCTFFSIYIDGINNHQIIRNNFVLKAANAEGVTIGNATGYKIEENDFTNTFTGPGDQTIGLNIGNSGSAENEVQSQHVIDYYYNQNANNEFPPIVSRNVNRIPTTASNGCPSKIGNPRGGGTRGGDEWNEEWNLEQALAQYDEWNAQYEYWLALANEVCGEAPYGLTLLRSYGLEDDECATLWDLVSHYSALKDNYFNAIIVEAMTEAEEQKGRKAEEQQGEINGRISPSNLFPSNFWRGGSRRLTGWLSILRSSQQASIL